jgi:hypothetical protein
MRWIPSNADLFSCKMEKKTTHQAHLFLWADSIIYMPALSFSKSFAIIFGRPGRTWEETRGRDNRRNKPPIVCKSAS